jgi:hypothetical protein
MNLDSFYTYLEQPQTLNGQSLVELNELVNRYPYFQSARLLYLKNLHLLNDYRYNEELRTVSAYAGNRKVLYELINEGKTNYTEIPEINNDTVIEENIDTTINVEKIIDNSDQKTNVDDAINLEQNNLIQNSEIKEEIKEPIESLNIIPEIKEDIKETENSQLIQLSKISEIKGETETKVEENNISHNISEKTELPANIIIEETSEVEKVIEVSVEKEIVIENNKQEIILPVVIAEPKIEKKEIIITEPAKESVADMILKKVAAIHTERAKLKEQPKEQIITKPIVNQDKPIVCEQKLLDEIIAEHKSRVKEVKVESEITIAEAKQSEEIIVEIKPEIEDVTADSFIALTEEEDLTNYNEIQENEYFKEEIKEVEPVSFTRNFKHVIIVSDEKEIALKPISEEKIISETKIEETKNIVSDYFLVEDSPIFQPAYDINSLLEKEIIKETEKTESLEQISMPFEKWLDFISIDSKKVSKSKTHPDLIEAFIKSEPRLSFKIASETSKFEQKEPLISHNEIELVSESLADIYAKQGLYDKAIKMYEKLALQYPEKNIYFANLILKTKKQNSNQ